MDISEIDRIARIRRSYDRLREAAALLEKSDEGGIAATLFLALGLLEERYDLASAEEIESAIRAKSDSIRSN